MDFQYGCLEQQISWYIQCRCVIKDRCQTATKKDSDTFPQKLFPLCCFSLRRRLITWSLLEIMNASVNQGPCEQKCGPKAPTYTNTGVFQGSEWRCYDVSLHKPYHCTMAQTFVKTVCSAWWDRGSGSSSTTNLLWERACLTSWGWVLLTSKA